MTTIAASLPSAPGPSDAVAGAAGKNRHAKEGAGFGGVLSDLSRHRDATTQPKARARDGEAAGEAKSAARLPSGWTELAADLRDRLAGATSDAGKDESVKTGANALPGTASDGDGSALPVLPDGNQAGLPPPQVTVKPGPATPPVAILDASAEQASPPPVAPPQPASPELVSAPLAVSESPSAPVAGVDPVPLSTPEPSAKPVASAASTPADAGALGEEPSDKPTSNSVETALPPATAPDPIPVAATAAAMLIPASPVPANAPVAPQDHSRPPAAAALSPSGAHEKSGAKPEIPPQAAGRDDARPASDDQGSSASAAAQRSVTAAGIPERARPAPPAPRVVGSRDPAPASSPTPNSADATPAPVLDIAPPPKPQGAGTPAQPASLSTPEGVAETVSRIIPRDADLSESATVADPARAADPSRPVAASGETHLMPSDQLAPMRQVAIAIVQSVLDGADRVAEAAQPATAAATPAPAASAQPLRTLTIELSPPDLGHVSVRMRLVGDQLEMHVAVEKHETLALIDRDRDVLSRSLKEHGYGVDLMTVSSSSDTALMGGNSGQNGAAPDQNSGRNPSQPQGGGQAFGAPDEGSRGGEGRRADRGRGDAPGQQSKDSHESAQSRAARRDLYL